MEGSKQIQFSDVARESIKQGIDIVTDAVKVTLGPQGRSVIIGRRNGLPHVTKDGVTVAKEIKLEDPFQDIGAQLIKEIASKTCSDVGDGTTTATILAQSIIEQGVSEVERGSSPIQLKNEIEEVTERVIQQIKSQSISIDSNESYIKQVATISANNDSVIGELIANTLKKITKDGVIVVEESKNMETYVDVISGMQFDRGYLAHHFITDFVKNECVYERVRVLITDMKINYTRDLIDVLEQLHNTREPLLIIAEDYDPSVIDDLKVNKMSNNVRVIPVKAPSFGEYRKDILQDIAILTESTVIGYETHKSVNKVTLEDIGYCDKVVVTKDNTTIIGGRGNVETRVELIKQQLRVTLSDVVKEILQQRIAKLVGGVGILHVGGVTEIEMMERKDRIDDALQATRAAIEEGIVVGGGMTYMNISQKLSCETTGEEIILEALRSPFYQILTNAGCEDWEIENVLDEIGNDTDQIGYNAKTRQIENLLLAGVIDPTKVACMALRNAVSIATLFLTTECLIVDKPIEVVNMF